MAIANHSWDHTHVALSSVRQRGQQKGTFLGIDNLHDADQQIAGAQRLIWYRTGGNAAPFFAYPYGEAPDYLVREYFPQFPDRHRIVAAFGTQGDYATPARNLWHIPRFVCGQHWKSPAELEAILLSSTRRS